MSKITDPDMQQAILDVIPLYSGTVSVSTIAFDIGLPISSVRYSLDALLAEGKIRKIPVVAYNKNYCRYKYEVVDDL